MSGGTTHERNRKRLAPGPYAAKWGVFPQRCPLLWVTSQRGRKPTPPVPATGGCQISGGYPCGAGEDWRLDRPKPQYSPVDVPSTPRYRRRDFLWGQLQFPCVRRARHTLTRPLVPANAARTASLSDPPDCTQKAHEGAMVVALTRGGRMAPTTTPALPGKPQAATRRGWRAMSGLQEGHASVAVLSAATVGSAFVFGSHGTTAHVSLAGKNRDCGYTARIARKHSVGLQSPHTASRSPPSWVTRKGSVRGYPEQLHADHGTNL